MRARKRTAEERQRSLEQAKSICLVQAGVIHRDQVLKTGFTVSELEGLVARGALERRFRWTYTFPGTGSSLKTRCWSAVLSAGDGALVTGAKALALMNALPERSGPIECLRPTGRPRPQTGLIVRSAPELATDASTTDGVPTTSFGRSIIELAALGEADLVDRALDTGARLRLFDGRAFERFNQTVPAHQGLSVLNAALARLDATTGLKRSELERRLIALIMESDLPTPLVNAVLHGREVDVHFPGTRAIIEADGREYHSSPADIARDIEKRRALEDLGYVIQLFDWDAVNYRPRETLEIANQFLQENQEPPVPRAR